jgi:predicted lipid-binding transport protein (Tim44 family)
MYDIASLQAQLAQLQASLRTQPATQAAQATPPVSDANANSVSSRDYLRSIVKEVLMEEVEAAKVAMQQKAATTPQEPVSAVSHLMRSIGNALDENDQVFLTKHIASVESELPKFLETEDGKLAIHSFILYLKGIYGN